MSTETIWFHISTKLVGMQELFFKPPTSDRNRGGVMALVRPNSEAMPEIDQCPERIFAAFRKFRV
jgi:hypothetical protein